MTTDTIGDNSTQSAADNGAVWGFPITASATGVLVSIGFNVAAQPGGNMRAGIYSTYSGNTLNGLLGQSAATAITGLGWVDAAIPGNVTITQGTTYYLAYQVDTIQLSTYYKASGTRYKGSPYSFGAFPDPTVNLGVDNVTNKNMRIIYTPSGGPARIGLPSKTVAAGNPLIFSMHLPKFRVRRFL